MTEELMPKEDNMGKVMAFLGGCVAGVAGVFAVAVMSESSEHKDNDGNASVVPYDGAADTE